MAEFEYFTPMDREYHASQKYRPKLEDPIFPIERVGQSIAETGRLGTLVQEVTAAIRGGAGRLEFQTMPNQRFEALGKEVRGVLKDVAAANNVLFQSVHAPIEIQNVTGFNPQDGSFNEQFKQEEMAMIKGAIDFASDVVGSGAVVVHPLAGEFPRPIWNAKWNQDGKWKNAFELYPNEKDEQATPIVDPRKGKMFQINAKEPVWAVKEDANGKIITDAQGKPAIEKLTWDDIQRLAKEKKQDPSLFYMQKKYSPQIAQSEGMAAHYQDYIRQNEEMIRRRNDEFEQIQALPEEHKAAVLRQRNVSSIAELKSRNDAENKQSQENIVSYQNSWASSMESVNELKDTLANLQPVDKFAIGKASEGYAEAAIIAMDKSHSKKGNLFIAIENSWPGGYSTHPEELIEVVKESRKKMVELLTQQKIKDEQGRIVDNPWYRSGISEDEASTEAAQHIKATFDSAHMGMWMKHFKGKLGETEDQRLKRFNEWFVDEAKKLAESGVVGNVHLVDSAGSSHQHLPIGQGILPVVDAMKEFKKAGYGGLLTSEAFEEEKFGAGRIRIETCKALGADVPSGMLGERASLSHASGPSYMAQVYAPRNMFGSYTPPSGEYTPWAGGERPIPFE